MLAQICFARIENAFESCILQKAKLKMTAEFITSLTALSTIEKNLPWSTYSSKKNTYQWSFAENVKMQNESAKEIL